MFLPNDANEWFISTKAYARAGTRIGYMRQLGRQFQRQGDQPTTPWSRQWEETCNGKWTLNPGIQVHPVQRLQTCLLNSSLPDAQLKAAEVIEKAARSSTAGYEAFRIRCAHDDMVFALAQALSETKSEELRLKCCRALNNIVGDVMDKQNKHQHIQDSKASTKSARADLFLLRVLATLLITSAVAILVWSVVWLNASRQRTCLSRTARVGWQSWVETFILLAELWLALVLLSLGILAANGLQADQQPRTENEIPNNRQETRGGKSGGTQSRPSLVPRQHSHAWSVEAKEHLERTPGEEFVVVKSKRWSNVPVRRTVEITSPERKDWL
jgi:hypothetical protein